MAYQDKFDGEDLRQAHADFSRKNYPALYEEGIENLKKAGYLAVPDLNGPWAYHRVYKLARPVLDGFNIPDRFKVWAEVLSPVDKELLVDLVLQWGDPSDKDDLLSGFWRPFHQPNKNRNSPLYVHVENLLRDESRAARTESAGQPINILLTPNPVIAPEGAKEGNMRDLAPITWLPREEWFPEAVKQVTPDDVLTIFPPAERKLLSLIIGRAVVGQSNHTPPGWGSPIVHTSRMMAILLGEDPGLGKTTLMKALFNALEKQGYLTETYAQFNARFNMGQIVTSHIVYKDDLADDDLKNLVKSGLAKQIISGADHIKVEDKGKDAYSVFPAATLFANTNNFNPRLIWAIDPGMSDRLKLISTYREIEMISPMMVRTKLSQDSPDLRPFLHIPYLAEKLGVTIDCIMLWLARICADRFLELIQTRTGLEKEVDRLTLLLREPLHKDSTSQLMTYLITVGCAWSRNVKDTVKAVVDDPDLGFHDIKWIESAASLVDLLRSDKGNKGIKAIREQLKKDFEETGSSDPLHPFMGCVLLDHHSLAAAATSDSVTTFHTDDKLLLVGRILKETRQIGGLNYTHDPVWLNKAFNKIRPRLPDILKIAKKLDD